MEGFYVFVDLTTNPSMIEMWKLIRKKVLIDKEKWGFHEKGALVILRMCFQPCGTGSKEYVLLFHLKAIGWML